jgi:hypothetical protein
MRLEQNLVPVPGDPVCCGDLTARAIAPRLPAQGPARDSPPSRPRNDKRLP